jgi:hypothetical protein
LKYLLLSFRLYPLFFILYLLAFRLFLQLVCQVAIPIKRNDVQAQLWTIPGPLFVCCILLMIALKSSFTPLMLPIIAVGGIVACNLWKWGGVAVSSILLAAVMVYSLQSQPSQTWIWTIALSLSIASTFVLTVLCSEEAYHALDSLSKDSTDHKQTLSLLNDRLQVVQSKLTAEQNEFALQRSQMQEQLAAKEEKQRSNEQLLKLARKEITSVLEKQEKLTQELLQANQKNAVMEAKILELQLNNKEREVHSKEKGQVESLSREISVLNRHKDHLEAALNEMKTKQDKLLEMTEGQNEALNRLSAEKELLLKQIQEMEAKRDEENETTDCSDAKQVDSLYQQLRQQFAEKTKILSTTRRELFLAQEKLSVFQIDRVESKLNDGRETMEALRRISEEAARELALMEREHAIEVHHLHDVIEALTTR